MISIGNLFQRNPVRNDFFRLYPPGLDMFDQARQMPLHARLVHAERKAFIKGVSNGDGIKSRAINTHNRYIAAFPNRIDSPVKGSRGTSLEFHYYSGQLLRKTSVSFTSNRIDAYIGSQPVRHLFDVNCHVIHVLEIDDFALGKVLYKLQAILQMINDDYPTGPQKPGAFGGEDAYWAGAENHNSIPFLDVSHFRRLIPGGVGIC